MRGLPEIPIQRFGAAVSAEIGVGEELRQRLRRAKRLEPKPLHVTLLIDTGASCSWIRPAYMTQLGLVPRSWFDVETTAGVVQNLPAFEISLILGGVGTPNTKRFETLIGVEQFDGTPHDGLLGRDILKYLQVAWNGPQESVRVQYE